MRIYLDDSHLQTKFYPFSATRHVATIRVGIRTLLEKWQGCAGEEAVTTQPEAGAIPIPANWLPTPAAIAWLQQGGDPNELPPQGLVTVVQHAADIVNHNQAAIMADIQWLLPRRQFMALPPTVTAINPDSILVEAGARLQYCHLNASSGPIYIAANAEIMEGTYLRGPVAVGEGALVKMGAKIYGATTIGPYCLAGGEIKNSILTAYSNKAHDGYLGDSVLGRWCNLGAGTSNSNIKNTAGNVTVTLDTEAVNAGLKSGLLLGDYSRSAINTSFNTGTVVGASCNIFGAGLTPTCIPHFSWGTGGTRYQLDKALRDIDNWMRLKNQSLTDAEKEGLTRLYNA